MMTNEASDPAAHGEVAASADPHTEGGEERSSERRGGHTFTIKIDRTEFRVHEPELTGLQLRHLPNPPIGPDRDLFEVVPGGSDLKIGDNEEVKMRDGLRFFTAPAQINPGRQ